MTRTTISLGDRRTALAGATLALMLLGASAFAATPPAGTISEANQTVNWVGPFLPATGSATCNGPNDAACDNFRLSVIPPSPSFGGFVIDITVTPELVGDWDLQVYDPAGNVVGSSGNSPGQLEKIVLSNPPAGTYTVAAAPFAPAIGPSGNSYTAEAKMLPSDSGDGEPTEFITYANFVPPPPLGRQGSAESNIGVCGVDPSGDASHFNDVLHLGSLQTLRLGFDECSSPPGAAWEDVSFLVTSQVTLDPILFTDRSTNRTITSQLAGKTSLMSITDDCGDTYIGPTQGAGINSGVDHQTVGGGPYNEDAIPPPPPPPTRVYPHAVYYCSQDIVTAQCARSDNGGLTFGPAVPVYDLTECGGLHGHIKVSPGGIVYVPNGGCNGEQAVVVSEDNGLTWDVRKIPGAVPGPLDPSLGIAEDDTVYFGWSNGGVQPKVAVSTNLGVSWFNVRDVANDFGVPMNNVVFPAVVAGDSDRAAMAFFGAYEPTRAGGSGAGDDPNWPGDWFLFVAHTYDQGDTWTTVNATPDDPVQRATICSSGIGCENGTRNLLDFMDANIDRFGRVLVGYQDGCIGECVKSRPNSFTANSVVARQVNGRRMFADFDVEGVPDPPLATATFDTCDGPPSAIRLVWQQPDNHGLEVTEFNIYRRTSGGSFLLLATVPGDVLSYNDATIDSNLTYFYQVTAVNALGEGPACDEIQATCGPITGSPCEFPGKEVLVDGTGDWTAPDPTTQIGEYDIEALYINERIELGAGKVQFVLKMVSMASPPANSTWPVLFNFAGDRWVRMHTDALGQVFFTYGTGTNTSPLTNAGSPADPQSGFSADGFIRIVVDRADIGGPATGDDLDQFLVRIRREGGAVALTPDNMPDGLARTGIYTMTDCELDCDPVTARDDFATTEENQPVVIEVDRNDSDGGNPPLQVINVSDPANGRVVNNGDGTLTYIPDVGFFSPPDDTFTYTIRSSCGATDSATVTVTVNPFCPIEPTGSFSDDFEPAAEPGWQVDTTANASGAASPTWQVVADPLTESPTNAFFSDATTLDLKDDRLLAPPVDLSATSRLIFFHRFFFESTFDGGVLEISTDGGRTWEDVLARDPGAFVAGGYNGTIDTGFGSPIAGRRAWTGFSQFIDAMNRVEVDLSAYAGPQVRVRWRLAADPLALGSLPGSGWWIDNVQFTNLLEVQNCNRPPVARDDRASTPVNTPVTLNVLADNGFGEDFDPEGEALTVTAVGDPPNGTATNDGGGFVTYTPDLDFVGVDSFGYTVCDPEPLCSSATVTVTVTEEPNQAPVARDDVVTTEEDTAIVIAVLEDNGNGPDFDPDGDDFGVTAVGPATNGTTADNGDDTVTYTPNPGFVGSDSFTYSITDSRGAPGSGRVFVTVTEAPNRRPEARDDAATTNRDTPVTIAVLANDSDPDGDPLSVGGVSDPPNGTATVNPDQTVTYSPDAGFTGTDIFTYTACDDGDPVLCDEATVTVQVVAPQTGKVTGGGWIPGPGSDGKRNFGFNAKLKGVADTADGRITYDANNEGISLKGTVNRLSVAGSDASFSGTCELRSTGQSCTYTVEVEDNGEPGDNDRFEIRVFDLTGSLLHQAGDVLGGGNIQIH